MLAFTIIMILLYIMCQFFSEILLNHNKRDSEGSLSQEQKENELLLIGCLFAPVMMAYSISYLIYLFFFLNHDTLLIPTYIMLALFLISNVKSIVTTAFNRLKEKPKLRTKRTLWGYFNMFAVMTFYVYALYVLIVGI